MIDFKNFVKEYCITGSIDSGLTRVSLSNIQNRILENFQNKRSLDLMSRQSGGSTLINLVAIYQALIKNEDVVIHSQRPKDTLYNLKLSLEYLPREFQTYQIIQERIKFKNSTIFVSDFRTPKRGMNSKIVFLDNPNISKNQLEEFIYTYAFSKEFHIVTSAIPSHKEFYENCEKLGFSKCISKWSLDELRDENWKISMMNSIGEKYFKQEFECEV